MRLPEREAAEREAAETLLHPLSDFVDTDFVDASSLTDRAPSYWYEGRCPQTGTLLKLPRTELAEAIARGLMRRLQTQDGIGQEGKMYGVLLVHTSGGQQVLTAFSGLLQGSGLIPGWVPPIPGRERVAVMEAVTLMQLEAMKQELITLHELPVRSRFADLLQQSQIELQQLASQQQLRKGDRQRQRQVLAETLAGDGLAAALSDLDQQSRQDGRQRRCLKRDWQEQLQPLQQEIETADQRMLALKQQRQQLSRQLQAAMHSHYWLTNFARASLPLDQVMPGGIPTGTGDCCAPKLLHYAATQGWQPLAMAEFWWSEAAPQGDKIPGAFYGACAERCQPLMGFLLSGVSGRGEADQQDKLAVAVPILYEDDWLLVVDKPAGLLSVPGRYRDRQDSVVLRLQSFPGARVLMPVHRLDQDTSGILLLAKDGQTHRHLSQQFQQRQVRKVYEAVVDGVVQPDRGVIDLPLWADPSDRPYQKVDWQRGKPSVTEFQVMGRESHRTRVEFLPQTGRTHQLRVHAADAQGLATAILGDRLYGKPAIGDRLHLHARELWFSHPGSGQPLHLQVKSPF